MTETTKSIITNLMAVIEDQQAEQDLLSELSQTLKRCRKERDAFKHHVSNILGWINYVSMSARYTDMTREESESFTWLMEATSEGNGKSAAQ